MTKKRLRSSARREVTLKAIDYVQRFVLPNVYFHTTTAYDMMRHDGVEICEPFVRHDCERSPCDEFTVALHRAGSLPEVAAKEEHDGQQ